ncbi:MAG: endolytic transglycosylase MltG [Candidatus Taylorbacteria bacterium]|nr:endolytic transglycosylase MltG [Candidatus Taylorbacteria bacterium]
MFTRPFTVIIALLKLSVLLGVLFSCTLTVSYFFFASPPTEFTNEIRVDVERGQSVLSIARELESKGIVRNAKIAANLMVYMEAEKKIKAGIYIFKRPESVFVVAKRLVTGDFGYIPVRVTVPEGTNFMQLARILNAKYPNMATSTLEAKLRPLEGYLFPDTYFFPPMATDEDIIKKMQDTFKHRIKPLEAQITASGRSLEEILILASILEEEVPTTVDRKLVADLLLRRMEKGMPLQVDATLGYLTGKGSAELSLRDLRIDNEYNTYTRKGLPPTPISNPGLDTIKAAISPTPNDYLFYLSDKDGITHFAKTYAEHLKYKRKYIDQQ